MIKAITTINKVQGTERKMCAEVEISGDSIEIMHEFNGIMASLEEQCPEILLKVVQMRIEERRHDN